MNRRSKYRNEKGYTLIEIVMVIVILGVIGAFTFQFVAHGVQAFKKSSSRKDLYDQGRLALERMVRELRDAKEVTDGSASSVTFKKAHPAQAADNTEEIKFQLNGTNLERVGDPNGTPATAVLASNVSSFTVTGVAPAGGGGVPCAITLDSVSQASTGTQTLSWSHTIGGGSNRLLVVSIGVEGDYPSVAEVNSVTFNGTSLTKAVENDVGAYQNTEIWYMLESSLPAAGSHTVQITTSGIPNDSIKAGAISVSGAAQSGPEATNSQDDNGAGWGTIQTSVTTLTDGAWVFDCVGSGQAITFTPDAGQTERFDVTTGSSGAAGSTKAVATAGSTTLGWTMDASSNRVSHVLAAFAPATGCGGGGTTLFSDDFEDGVMTDWSKVSGLDMQETGGVFTTTGNDASHYQVDSSSSWTDYTYDVDAIANDDDALGITFRVEDSNSFYLLEQRFGDSTWDLRLRVNDNGSWSTLGTVANYGTNPGQVDSQTTSYNYKVQVSGTNIKAYIDDVLKFDVNDATVSGGTVGLWISWANGTTFDNVLVEGYGGNLATLEITLTDPNDSGNTVTMRSKVYLRNLP